jgi:3-keto steroid reductase
VGSRSPTPANETNSYVLGTHPIRFGSQTGLWGDEHVGLTKVAEWETHKEEGEVLLARCDSLLHSLRVSERVTMDFETASEHM